MESLKKYQFPIFLVFSVILIITAASIGHSIETTPSDRGEHVPVEPSQEETSSPIFENITFNFPTKVKQDILYYYNRDYPNETSMCLQAFMEENLVIVHSVEKAQITFQNRTQVASSCRNRHLFKAHSHIKRGEYYCQLSDGDVKAMKERNEMVVRPQIRTT